jgi:hypothetical protein
MLFPKIGNFFLSELLDTPEIFPQVNVSCHFFEVHISKKYEMFLIWDTLAPER